MAKSQKPTSKSTAGRTSRTKKTNVALKGESAEGKSMRTSGRDSLPATPPRAQAGEKRPSAVRRAGSAVARTARKLTSKLNPRTRRAAAAEPAQTAAGAKRNRGTQSRTVRRETDVPLDVIAQTYTPKQTSLKASFRSDGTDQHSDQEMAGGFADQRWEDEDHFTNKSGDARIGTHGRSYEPGEMVAAAENENRR